MTAEYRHIDDGWVLFDTLIGAVILTVGLLGASLVFNASNQSLEQVDARQSAVSLATSLVSVATAYGCGSETGLSLSGRGGSAGSGYPTTQSIWAQCSPIYAGRAGAPFSGALGDPFEVGTLPGGTGYAWTTSTSGATYDVSYQAVWTQGADQDSGCPTTLTGGAPAIAPIGQTRTVIVQWLDQLEPQEFSASMFGGVPVDALAYSSPTAGGLVVTGMKAGSVARLSVAVASFDPGQSGTVLVDRIASPGTGAPDTGCAWFPFLPPQAAGAYSLTYYATGDPQGPPTATSPRGMSVSDGAITSWAA